MSIIWLPTRKYKDKQTTKPGFEQKWFNPGPYNYVAVSLKRNYEFDKEVKSVSFKFACDTSGFVYVNDKLVCNSNNKPAYDFHNGNLPADELYFANKKVEFVSPTKSVNFLAFVQMSSPLIYDFSSGKGGFVLEGVINFKDNTSINIESDNSWDIRLENSFYDFSSYDASRKQEPWVKAEVKNYKWTLLDTNIKMTVEKEVACNNFIVKKNSTKKFVVHFPIVYAAFYEVECKCKGNVKVSVDSFEIYDKKNNTYESVGLDNYLFVKDDKVRLFDLHSVGGYVLNIENNSNDECEVIVHVNHSHYPYEVEKEIITNDKHLNDIFKKCEFAAVNCSQNILLDSPKHCEPLASCSGDYHIISLVLAMATGNFDLSKHVLKGYADLLVRNKGQNANDNYSMIHTIWLWDHYMMTGDKELLKQCVKGCEASAKLYLKSIGEQGIIDHPRRYCFIDWLNIDGYNLFSAPACLGQSVMNMFFYKSLACLSDIYKEIGEEKLSKKYASKARKLKKAINNVLFDKERGLYFEGQLEVPSGYKTEIPEGNGKIHFRKHANILAVAYGLTTKKQAKAIINKTFGELNELEVQPYFMHYYFEAIHKAGLDNKYARKLLEYWTKNIKIADKALPEGFYKPHPTYPFDYSHAWACSPYYSFIIASSGLNILEPGMKKISLNLSSLRLSNVSYSIGTPYGFIDVKLEKGKEPQIKFPSEIEYTIL